MKTYIRFVAILLLCLISSTALADIVMPESLHRIGYEVLVYATGAAAALGGGLLARYRKRKVLATAKPIAEWKTEDCVTAEERNDIEAKLNAGIPFIKDVFDQRYEELLPKWLAEDKKLPNCMSEWKSKNEDLLKEILVSDGEVAQRFTGVPLEYLRDRLMKPMPDDFTGGWFAKDQLKHEMRRKIIRTLITVIVLVAVVYLSGMIAMALGAVEVSAPNVAMKVFKIVFYPLLPIIGVSVILFVSLVAWIFVFIPLKRWCREKWLMRMAERCEKVVKMSQPGTSTGRQEPSENTVPFVCDDVQNQTPLVVGEQGGIVFGRSRRSDVRLDEQDVSGRHVEIVREGDQILAVCLSRQGMVVNEESVELSGRRELHEGDRMRIGMKAEVHVVRLPKDGDDVMVLRVQDCRGTREEVVRFPKGDDDTAFCCDDGDSASDGGGMLCTKPIIYLYPQSPIKCSVSVRFDGKLTCTYPAHGTEGWRDFVAAPDGTLTFPGGRKFYCLYWEGTTPMRWDFSKGYCVKGEDTAAFLADVLAKMGLSFREANEFIIYWLPRMQVNPYNVIAFQGERYAESAKLEIEPKPDSILRVFMAWKASDQPVDIPAPEIKSFERKGFTVVEWGGTEVGK